MDIDEPWTEGLDYPMDSFQEETYSSSWPGESLVVMPGAYVASSFSSDSSGYTDMTEEEHWHLKLPIHGEIALRRAFKRGEDPFTIEREQRSNYVHEIESKYGPLNDVEIVFFDVDYTAVNQPRSVIARMMEGEPISPGALPTPGQMSIAEYCEAFGVDKKYIAELMMADEVNIGGTDQQEPSSANLLAQHPHPRVYSEQSVEQTFELDPFKGRPASA